jgi:hypothetical protein
MCVTFLCFKAINEILRYFSTIPIALVSGIINLIKENKKKNQIDKEKEDDEKLKNDASN